MKKSVWFLFLLTAVLLLSGNIQTVQAETTPEPPSDDEVNILAGQMYCPVCENIPLDSCGTQACEQWRELIREKLAAGWENEQIKDYFVLQYGDRVLAEPPRRGLNWLIYILPPVLILGSVFVLISVLRTNQKNNNNDQLIDQKPTETESDIYLSRMEEELRKKEME
ncbi:MAG: cytochrome c-type biogenesis protein CcmH [Anaerolineaceae bacterium]|nr:cytochrome c-type biogenesis protein CcmH [Anaerolineaceae bacterium]